MLGMSLETAMPLVKSALEKEKLQSIVVRLIPESEENKTGVEILKYTKDVIVHIQEQSAYIKTISAEAETSLNDNVVLVTTIEEVRNILASRKNAENKLKAIEKLFE